MKIEETHLTCAACLASKRAAPVPGDQLRLQRLCCALWPRRHLRGIVPRRDTLITALTSTTHSSAQRHGGVPSAVTVTGAGGNPGNL